MSRAPTWVRVLKCWGRRSNNKRNLALLALLSWDQNCSYSKNKRVKKSKKKRSQIFVITFVIHCKIKLFLRDFVGNLISIFMSSFVSKTLNPSSIKKSWKHCDFDDIFYIHISISSEISYLNINNQASGTQRCLTRKPPLPLAWKHKTSLFGYLTETN